MKDYQSFLGLSRFLSLSLTITSYSATSSLFLKTKKLQIPTKIKGIIKIIAQNPNFK